ncbi:MAG: acetolactate synthase large subunit [Rickettsiales bacterium]|nr:acetolactate synthase large subunit [Rickettsiales bacterium]
MLEKKNLLSGAQALLKSLINSGIEVIFANPGTSEMHLVSAIGIDKQMRAILCLFEGVVTGAADGYWRMKKVPAATLLHLGPGYANGMANMHNAKRAYSGIVNIVGDHATWHLKYDAPLTSDLFAHVKIHSDWIGKSKSADDLAHISTKAVSVAKSGWGKISTIIVPANHAWETGALEKPAISNEPCTKIEESRISRLKTLIENSKKCALLMGGDALNPDSVKMASIISQEYDAELLAETFCSKISRGEGRVHLERVPYFAEYAIDFLSKFDLIILVGAKDPVGFFAYPDVKSRLAPEECIIFEYVKIDEDALDALKRFVEKNKIKNAPILERSLYKLPKGKELNAENMSKVIANEMPDNCIISDEGITCSQVLYNATVSSPKHDWLCITGGAIGQGLPVSFGASIACPDRKVIAFQADGSAMYTLQTLWSMTREKSDVTVVIINNKSYAILNIELKRLKTSHPNDKTLSMLDLNNPSLDWVQLSRGMGMEASNASTLEEFKFVFNRAMRKKGPFLINAIIQQDKASLFKN